MIKHPTRILSAFVVCIFMGSLCVPMVSAIAPPQIIPYYISGYVENSNTGAAISGAYVKLYAGSTYIAQVSTPSSGYFSYSYTSGSTVSSFKAVVSKSGFSSKTVTVSVSGSDVYFGTIYLTPVFHYAVSGTVVDSVYAQPLSHVTVNVFSPSGLVKEVTTDSSGAFSCTFDTSSSISFVKADCSCLHYTEKVVEKDNPPATYAFPQISMDRNAQSSIVWSCDFSYASAAYTQLWTSDNTITCTTDCVDQSYAYVQEVSGATGGNGIVKGEISLNNWTGNGDLTLEVRIRAESSGGFLGFGTNYVIGLESIGSQPTIYWSKSQPFFAQDTGYLTEDYVISSGTGIQPKQAMFYWGYNYQGNYNQRVELDYVRIYGNPIPATPVEENGLTYTNGVKEMTYDYQGTPSQDSDIVGIATTSSIAYDSILGFGSIDQPDIWSSIVVCMDPDMVGSPSQTFCSVDKVSVTVAITTDDTNHIPAGGNTIYRRSLVNEPGSAPPEEAQPATDILLGAVALIPEVGGFVALTGSIMLFDASTTAGGFSTQEGAGTCTATYELTHFSGDNIGQESTDFKMELLVHPTDLVAGLYRITFSYAVTVKRVTVTPKLDGGQSYLEDDFQVIDTSSLTSQACYIHYYDDENAGNLHLVHLGPNIQVNAQPNTGTFVYPTCWGRSWVIVRGKHIQVSSIASVTAIDNVTWDPQADYSNLLYPFRVYASSFDEVLLSHMGYYSFVGV